MKADLVNHPVGLHAQVYLYNRLCPKQIIHAYTGLRRESEEETKRTT